MRIYFVYTNTYKIRKLLRGIFSIIYNTSDFKMPFSAVMKDLVVDIYITYIKIQPTVGIVYCFDFVRTHGVVSYIELLR